MTEMQRDIAEDVDLMEELMEKCLGTIGKKILNIKYINTKEQNAWWVRYRWKMCDKQVK